MVWHKEEGGTRYQLSRWRQGLWTAGQIGAYFHYRLDITIDGALRTNLWRYTEYNRLDPAGKDDSLFEFLGAVYEPSADASVVVYKREPFRVFIEHVKRGTNDGRPAKREQTWALERFGREGVCRAKIEGSLPATNLTVQLFELNAGIGPQTDAQERLRWTGEGWTLEREYRPMPPRSLVPTGPVEE